MKSNKHFLSVDFGQYYPQKEKRRKEKRRIIVQPKISKWKLLAHTIHYIFKTKGEEKMKSNYTIFDYFAEQHNLTLLESEIQEVERIVNSALQKENQELTQKLVQANNSLIGKDAKIASMQNACEPLIVEGACGIVYWLYQAICDNPEVDSYRLTEQCLHDVKRIGKGLQDYQADKPNPFSDEYFRGLTYDQIAELAKKSLRLTAEHCSDLHKIEELEEQIVDYTETLVEISSGDICQAQRNAKNVLDYWKGKKGNDKEN